MEAEVREPMDPAGRACNKCVRLLTKWETQIASALKYKYPNCIDCMAEEYDMNTADFDNQMKGYQGVRPCLFV